MAMTLPMDGPPQPLKPTGSLTGYVLRTGNPLLAPPEVYADLVKAGQVPPAEAFLVEPWRRRL